MTRRTMLSSHRLVDLVMLVVALALVLTLAGANIASAQSGPVGVVKTGQLNLRSGPGPGFSVVGALIFGEDVIMLGRTTDSAWINVQTSNGTTGCASSLYLLSGVPFSSLPVVAEPVPWAFVTTGTANMRAGPGLEFAVVTTINAGNYVNIHARSIDGNWVYSSWNGIQGWLSTGVIVSNTPFASLPTTVPTATPIPGSTPSGTPTGGTTTGTGNGLIKGLIYPIPADLFIPPLNIYALNIATGDFVGTTWRDDCAMGLTCTGEYPGSFPFTLGPIPAGDYVVFAYRATDEGGLYGAYTKNPGCKGPGTVDDHSFVILHMTAGATISGANICDQWTKEQGVVPPEPHK